ncbi:MAG: hypothetical protein IPO04_21510 [Cytophagaceae bacterium]|nr:hypothetical protein [Cytophagaceae bacterium]
MARQKGLIKLDGTIGGITFYKSKDGYLAREKGGVSGDRIANDPNFQRTRENGEEFGRAGKAGRLLRTALRNVLKSSADGRMVGRLTAEMVKVIQADVTNTRGQRNVIDGEAELLIGFDFNIKGKLRNTLYAPYTQNLSRATGLLEVTIPAFVPANMIAAPNGATHFKIESAGAEVDFENEVFVTETSETSIIALDGTATAPITLSNAVSPNSVHPLFLVLGIEFFQEVNGEMYSLKNGMFNSLTLIGVNGSQVVLSGG